MEEEHQKAVRQYLEKCQANNITPLPILNKF
jgi:hypothetical protein